MRHKTMSLDDLARPDFLLAPEASAVAITGLTADSRAVDVCWASAESSV